MAQEHSFFIVLTYLHDLIPINNMGLFYKPGLKTFCVILCKLRGNFSTDTNFRGFGSMESGMQK